MKKYSFLLILITVWSFAFFFMAKTPTYADGCEEISGRFTANNWPGGKVRVSCNGDNPPGPHNCVGSSQELSPGDSFDFTNCSCLDTAQGGADPGCLKIERLDSSQDSCVATSDFGAFCGANGDHVTADFGLDCPRPTPACNTTCSGTQDCSGALNGCTACLPGNSPTGKTCQQPPTTPACGTPCSNPSACNGAQNGCTACVNGTCQQPPACNTPCSNPSACNGAQNGCTACVNGKCQQPPPGSTPVPTSPPPACNTPCSNPSACNGAQNGCTACVNGKCQQPPPGSTPVPTSPPAACNTSCSKDSQCAGAKDGCTVCGSGGKCVPAPTPTPAFNENWCTCDGLDTNPASFFPGDTVSFISHGKVEAPYLDRAKVQSMEFYVYRGDATTATRVADSGPIAAEIESQSATKNRYQSTWSYKIPTDITKDEIFRVQSKIKCVPQNVLGASTSIRFEPTLIDRVVSFIGYIFGFRSQPVAMDYQAAPAPTESALVKASPTSQVLAAKSTLQLDTFTPAQIIEKSCSIIRFKFGN